MWRVTEIPGLGRLAFPWPEHFRRNADVGYSWDETVFHPFSGNILLPSSIQCANLRSDGLGKTTTFKMDGVCSFSVVVGMGERLWWARIAHPTGNLIQNSNPPPIQIASVQASCFARGEGRSRCHQVSAIIRKEGRCLRSMLVGDEFYQS